MTARFLAFAVLVLVSAATMLAGILAATTPAQAHERWADNTAVPAWVKEQCCGPADAHRLDPGQVHSVQGGFYVDGYEDQGKPKLIRADRLLPSPDGEWWVFYRRYSDDTVSTVYCFFGPAGA